MPMPMLVRAMPSGQRMRTVAVGSPIVPHTTCACQRRPPHPTEPPDQGGVWLAGHDAMDTAAAAQDMHQMLLLHRQGMHLSDDGLYRTSAAAHAPIAAAASSACMAQMREGEGGRCVLARLS